MTSAGTHAPRWGHPASWKQPASAGTCGAGAGLPSAAVRGGRPETRARDGAGICQRFPACAKARRRLAGPGADRHAGVILPAWTPVSEPRRLRPSGSSTGV